ncbi:MAG: LPS export ABC transporter periplasmic protein LptC [Bacillota bacterium]
MLKKRFWLVFLIILVSAITVLVFWQTLQQGISTGKLKTTADDSQAGLDEFSGMKIKIPGAEKDGYWELTVSKFADLSDVGRLNKVEGSYYRGRKPVYLISGETGVIYWNSRVLELQGNVLIKTYDGSKKITADELVWDPNQKTITARHNVTLETSNLTVNAETFSSNLYLNRASFTGMTKAVYERVDHD